MKKLRTNDNTAFLPSNNILLWGRFFLRISTLSMQIKIGLKNVLKENVEKLLVAYEPVWAIGMAGEVAAPDYVAARMVSIRKAIQTLFPGCMVPVLFGGSVNETNAQLYLEQSRADGLFIGRAAWDADRFYNIITQLMKE